MNYNNQIYFVVVSFLYDVTALDRQESPFLLWRLSRWIMVILLMLCVSNKTCVFLKFLEIDDISVYLLQNKMNQFARNFKHFKKSQFYICFFSSYYRNFPRSISLSAVADSFSMFIHNIGPSISSHWSHFMLLS